MLQYSASWTETVTFTRLDYMGNITVRHLVDYLVARNIAKLEFSANSDIYKLIFTHSTSK